MKNKKNIINKDFGPHVPTVPTPTSRSSFWDNTPDKEWLPLSDEYMQEYDRLKLLEGPDLTPEDNTLIVERIPGPFWSELRASLPSNSPRKTSRIEAIQILRDLAAGTDPITKTTLPDESPYQSAKVLRALQLAIDTVTYRAMKKASQQPAAAGAPWTEEENRRLIADYRAGVSAWDLSRKHNRSLGAIKSRLEKLLPIRHQ